MIKFRKALTICCLSTISFSPVTYAERFFSSSSISILHSDQYQGVQFDAGGNGGEEYEATYFTFENATVHNWGTTFFFMDRDQGRGRRNGVNNTYGEFSPNLSLSWLTGSDLSFGPVQDVFLSSQYNFGGGNETNNYL